MALLEIRALTVDFAASPPVRAVDSVDLSVAERESVAIVGESGSGKSQLLLACTGLLAANGRATGSVRFDGVELLGPGNHAAAVRGRGIGFVFQDAGGSLTPHRRIGDQLAEVASATRGLAREAAQAESRRLLDCVHLPDAGQQAARVSARALGRHAPARCDRARTCSASAAAVCGRTDDRARRHRPGGDPCAPRGSLPRVRHGAAARHARPGRRRCRWRTASPS